MQDITKRIEAEGSLLRSQQYVARGDFEAAIKENARVLSLSGDSPPSDQALFNLGLIYAHYENPQRNYRKSLVLFRRLLKDYSKSYLFDRTRIWVGLLEEIQSTDKEFERLNRTIEKLNGENQRLNKKIEKSRKENQRLNNEINELIYMIKRSKQVDIEVEKKKRDKAR
ncbi:MAG: hypothetical protein ACE5JU_05870 [Candidatus Binatia bacterium]